MNRSENCILSFGRDLHHRHITAEQDVRNELLYCSLQREKPISGMSLTAANCIAASWTTSSTVIGI